VYARSTNRTSSVEAEPLGGDRAPVLFSPADELLHPPAVRRRVWLLGGAFLLALVLVTWWGLFVGSVSLTPGEVWAALLGEGRAAAQHIVWDLRLPRLFAAALVGSALAASGAILQGVLRNPLADPALIGVSAGAGLVAAVVFLLFPEKLAFLPLGAFFGGLGTTFLIYAVAWLRGAAPVTLILVGLAMNAVFGAAMTALMVVFGDRVAPVVFWHAGRLTGVSWPEVRMAAPYAAVGIFLPLLAVRPLKMLLLGDEVAASLGFPVRTARFFLIALASFLAGTAVSVAGLLGFVGLVVPHIVRLLVGGDYLYVLPLSRVFGGLFVALADTAARTVLAPFELPVGVFLSAVGGLFFLYLLFRGKVGGVDV